MIPNKEANEPKENYLTGRTDINPILESLYGSLYRFAVHLTRSESDAADLVQQTFLILIQHLYQIRDLSRMKRWLFTTLRRNFLMEIRHRTKHPEVEFLPNVHDLEVEDSSPWSTLGALEVRKALLQVDEIYRVTLELFYVSDLSYREIGEALEIRPGTVMSRLSRGKAQLKSILSRNGYGDGRMQ